MLRVLCAVDEAVGTTAALHAAIAFCRHQDAELGLVGVVRPGLLGRRRGTRPERLRHYAGVRRSLEQATEVARHAGLRPTVAIRVGDPRHELVTEGRATGASGLFLARKRGRLSAALERQPQVSVEEITLGTTSAKAMILLCVGIASLAVGSVERSNATTPAAKALVAKLKEKHRSGVSGTMTLAPMGKGVRVVLRLNTRARGSLPAHIHTGPCRREPTFANPRIYISLLNVVNGKSVTNVTRTKLKTLRAGRFSINVHSPDYAIVACGDIPRAS